MVESNLRYGATPEEWDQFEMVLGLGDDLLPVVSNISAKISSASKVKKIGKTPSLYNREGKVRGFPDWPAHQTTSEEIKAWRDNPDYGICIQARAVRAFDIDVPDNQLAEPINSAIQKHIPLPIRWRMNSGKCLHAFLVKGEFGKRRMAVKGGYIEFLGNGNQFVAAGAHESGARYQWMHYQGLTRRHGIPDEIPEITPEQFEEIWKDLEKEFAVEPSSTDRAPGDRKKGVTDQAKMLADPIVHFLSTEGKVLSWNKDNSANITCPWKNEHTTDNGETETTYFPAGTGGYNDGHFKCMHAHCAHRADQDFLTEIGYYVDMFEDVSAPEDKEKEKQKRDRFMPLSINEFLRRPPVQWLIKNILPRGESMTFGASGSGKTFAILDLALRLAHGMEWNGHRAKQSRVVYICAEGAGGFVSRVKAWAQHHKISTDEFEGWFCVIPDTPNFLKEDEIKNLAEKINTYFNGKCDFIIIDTLAQVTAGADENSAKDMGLALRHAKWLGALTHAGYNLVHHTGKDEEKGPRGSSVIKGQLDAMFYIFRKTIRTFWVEKMKDGKDGFGYNFDLQTEILGQDSDGDEISSCLVLYSGNAKGKKSGKVTKYGRWQRNVLSAWEALGGDTVTVIELLEEVKRQTVPEDGKRDHRVGLAMQAIEVLANDKIFVLRDGTVSSGSLEEKGE